VKKILIAILILSVLLLSACAGPSEPKVLPYPGEGAPPPPEGYEYEVPPAPTPTPSPTPTPTPEPEPEPEPESESEVLALFTITKCEQTYCEPSDEWGRCVHIYYTIENTGNTPIDYCEVYFVAECSGGKEYEDWNNSTNIDIGKIVSDDWLLDVNSKKVERVEITDWELTHHGLPTVSKPSHISNPSKSCVASQSSLCASFTIKHWDQDYYDYFDEWTSVEVYYEIENIGALDIDYYEVYFIAECKGGKEYWDWTNGLNVKVGKTVTDSCYIDVDGSEAESIEIET